MSAMGPEEVIESKHAMAGIAEILAAYHAKLREEGFSRRDAMRIVIAYQQSLVLGSQSENA